jgi:hypothetical protein
MKEVFIKKDGDSFVATFGDFINLQESPAGYGSTPNEVKENLYAESESAGDT